MFSPEVARALALTRASTTLERTIDITTIGARSGRPHRIEVWFYVYNGRQYLSTTPAKRDWYANLLVNPRFMFHLKNGVRADLPATATPITDPAVRLPIFEWIVDDLNQPHNPGHVPQPQLAEDWLKGSPLALITFDDNVAA